MSRRQKPKGVTYKVEGATRQGEPNRFVRIVDGRDCPDLLEAPFPLEDFGFRSEMSDDEIEHLLITNESDVTVQEIRQHLNVSTTPPSEPGAVAARRHQDDLEYFPDDGYDYSQHLVSINKGSMSMASTEQLKKAQAIREGADLELDDDGVAAVAALSGDEADEDFPDDFVAVAQTDEDGFVQPVQMSEVLWGKYQPTGFELPAEVAARLRELREAVGAAAFSAGGVPKAEMLGSDFEIEEMDDNESDFDSAAFEEEFRDLFEDDDDMEIPEGFELYDKQVHRAPHAAPTNEEIADIMSRIQRQTDDNPILHTGYEDDSEEEQWDVETVQSLRSNVYNHPGKIRIVTQEKRPILLYGKHKIPLDYIQDYLVKAGETNESEAPTQTEEPPVSTTVSSRPKQESPDEKRARKKHVHEAQRLKRQLKKAQR
ncbi:MAG: hypothetical protein KVP17_001516 [Porospora cf. gigantea B]|uniref:uncharacterized protein n=1 Tax=Porospora cf. gigantea B TaxID=2853592 RepID=UPI003571F22A|nr:MAG: hypothetical protein KVP17_001516 [Porospora cf. gigantea B]